MIARLLVSLLCVLSACDAPPPRLDAGAEDSGGGSCADASECDDGLFCNGAERCDPSDGCVAGEPPCGGMVCAEAEGMCVTCEVTDMDGDGVDSIACGGSDCDDTDSARFPGNVEVCDGEVDEDCDPTTLGTDGDNDGHVDAACCNRLENGALSCGDDCDDTMSGVHPGIAEACNGVDEDCDERTDEGTTTTCHADGDNDGYPPEGAETREQCMSCTETDNWASAPRFPTEIDCDDSNPDVNPGEAELCDDIDSDCSDGGAFPAPDEDFDRDGQASTQSPCNGGPIPKTDCNDRDDRVRLLSAIHYRVPHCTAGAEVGCRLQPDRWSCRFPQQSGSEACDMSGGPIADASAPSWDFNCDFQEEPEAELTECQCTAGRCGEPPLGGPFQAAGRSVGPAHPPEPSDCGSEVAALYCRVSGGPTCGGLGGNSCNLVGMLNGTHAVRCR